MRRAPILYALAKCQDKSHTPSRGGLVLKLYHGPRWEVKRGKAMRHRKRTTVWAYLDGKKLVDVVQAALDNNMMVDDLKAQLIRENPGHEVTFKVQ